MRCRVNLWLVLDIVLYVACLSVAIVLGRSIIVPRPGHVSCTDLDIQFAYGSDTISLALVLVSCALLPAPVILLTEVLTLNAQGPRYEASELSGSRSRLKEALHNTARLFWDQLVGMGMAYLLLEVLKVGTARPRPNFWDTCGNDTHSRLCGNSNYMALVELDQCSNPHHLSWSNLADAAKSFPSGHSCFATFIALFMTAYYHRRLLPGLARTSLDSDRSFSESSSSELESCGWMAVARKWVPLLWIAWATVVSASRIWDHKHHWHDVLGGILLGSVMALYTVVIITKDFEIIRRKCSHKRSELELNTYRAVPPN